jgi:four helix bundle protein
MGVISQLRRAASSVPANIAEGSRRRSGSHFAHFLNTAEASLAETEYHLMLARDLGYTSELQVHGLFARISELGKKLFALRAKVEGRAPNGRSTHGADGGAS